MLDEGESDVTGIRYCPFVRFGQSESIEGEDAVVAPRIAQGNCFLTPGSADDKISFAPLDG